VFPSSCRPRKAFLISLLLHAGALALFIFVHSDSVREEKPVDRIWMEVSDVDSSHRAQSRGRSSEAIPGHHHSATPSVRIQNLGIRYGWEEQKNRASKFQDAAGGSQSVLQEDAKLPLYHYVYDRINGNLSYPMELVAKRITGSVTGVLAFSSLGSESGEFLEEHSRLSGDSSFLKVAVLRAIRRAFRDGIPPQFIGRGRSLEVSCHFIFEILEHEDETLIAKRQGIAGKDLAFYRSFEESALQWQLGPLSGLGPLASLDVTWFPRTIVDLLSNKAKIDPLDSYRDDAAW
jgi:hypothetical protein